MIIYYYFFPSKLLEKLNVEEIHFENVSIIMTKILFVYIQSKCHYILLNFISFWSFSLTFSAVFKIKVDDNVQWTHHSTLSLWQHFNFT